MVTYTERPPFTEARGKARPKARTYICGRCGGQLTVFLDLSWARCPCGDVYSLKPKERGNTLQRAVRG